MTEDGASHPGRPRERDVDRGVGAGAVVALLGSLLLQGFLLGVLKLSGTNDGPVLGPLRYAGFTQWVYLVPALWMLVNRGCPRMAKGVLAVGAAVLVASGVALVA